MPARAKAEEEARQEVQAALTTLPLEQLEEELLDPTAPLIEGAMVIYTGSARNQTVAMPGRLMIEEYEGEVDPRTGEPTKKQVKTVIEGSEGGHTSYDFSTHDIFGRLIKERMVGPEYGPELANRRGEKVEHAAHLHAFFRIRGRDGAPAFRVMVPPAKRPILEEYIARVERRRGSSDKLYHDTGGVVRGSE